MNVVLLGPPGAGKGTQAERLGERYGWPAVATGDIFRAAVSEGTQLGFEVKKYLDSGELAPDEVVEGIVTGRLDQEDCREGFILDGFPRSRHQAEALDGYLAANGRRIDQVINITVEQSVLEKRLSGRRACRACGANYHVVFSPPVSEGTCECGGELYQRDDDNEATVRNRLEVYQRQTEPLVEYYQPSGLMVTIEGSGSRDEVFSEICEALNRAEARVKK